MAHPDENNRLEYLQNTRGGAILRAARMKAPAMRTFFDWTVVGASVACLLLEGCVASSTRQSAVARQSPIASASARPAAGDSKGTRASDRPMFGSNDAAVTVTAFLDFECAFCARAYSTLRDEVLVRYGNSIRFKFVSWPLPWRKWSEQATIAAYCAYAEDPDSFWLLSDNYFANQGRISADSLEDAVASVLGPVLSTEGMARFQSCFQRKATLALVQADLAEGQARGVRGTPTVFVQDTMVAGAQPAAVYSATIDDALRTTALAADHNRLPPTASVPPGTTDVSVAYRWKPDVPPPAGMATRWIRVSTQADGSWNVTMPAGSSSAVVRAGGQDWLETFGAHHISIDIDPKVGQTRYAGLTFTTPCVVEIRTDGTVLVDRAGTVARDRDGLVWQSGGTDGEGRNGYALFRIGGSDGRQPADRQPREEESTR